MLNHRTASKCSHSPFWVVPFAGHQNLLREFKWSNSWSKTQMNSVVRAESANSSSLRSSPSQWRASVTLRESVCVARWTWNKTFGWNCFEILGRMHPFIFSLFHCMCCSLLSLEPARRPSDTCRACSHDFTLPILQNLGTGQSVSH